MSNEDFMDDGDDAADDLFDDDTVNEGEDLDVSSAGAGLDDEAGPIAPSQPAEAEPDTGGAGMSVASVAEEVQAVRARRPPARRAAKKAPARKKTAKAAKKKAAGRKGGAKKKAAAKRKGAAKKSAARKSGRKTAKKKSAAKRRSAGRKKTSARKKGSSRKKK